MKRDPRLYLRDIDGAATRIRIYLSDHTESEFLSKELLQDGVIRNLKVIGEAVKRLPSVLKEDYPEIPWKTIAGLRVILIHEYFGVQLHQIWLVVNNELILFHAQVQEILKKLEDTNLFTQ